jgi:zinc transporter, ZIP family
LAASSLVIGSLVAIWLTISLRVIGLIMGFGAGVLISAFDLVEAAGQSSGYGVVAWGLFVGCGVSTAATG